MADLLELDLADLDVILAMDSIHACYASVNWTTRAVKL